jgi:RNA polymerase sigma-70 factor (ECF subfamily)
MVTDHEGLLTSPRTNRAVDHLARWIARDIGLGEHEIEDLRQDLLLHLVRRAPRYDPRRSAPQTFADRVLRNRASSLFRQLAQHSLTRQPRAWSVEELQEAACSGAAEDGAPHLSVQGYLRATSTAEPSEALDLKLDLEKALASLPPELRAMAHLRGSMTMTELAARVGISRSAATRRMRRIQDRLVEAGVAEHIGHPGPRTLDDQRVCRK